MMMIIIEGPDGAGKTTLLNRLLERYPALKHAPRACTSIGGPLRGNELNEWLRKYGIMYGHISDRHPCISGAVYDAVYSDTPEYSVRARLQRTMSEIREVAKVIYCRPHRREIVKSVNESAQMSGVDRNIHRIIDTYDAIMANMLIHERYDWTRDELPSL